MFLLIVVMALMVGKVVNGVLNVVPYSGVGRLWFKWWWFKL